MKKPRLLIATVVTCMILLQQKAIAQFYFYNNEFYDTPIMFEFGGSVGVMNCLTDVGGKIGNGGPFLKDLTFGTTQMSGSIYLSALYKYAVGVRLEGTFGRVRAHDSVSLKSVSEGRFERNLSFKSNISEVALVAEFHPVHIFVNWLMQENEPPRLSPYLAAGIGYFSFNPQTLLNNNWIDLQPLSTEGQGFLEYPGRQTYKLSQVNFPVGGGLKYELSPTFNFRLEVMHRILHTDYLDDLSTRYINPNLYRKYFSGLRLAQALALNDRRSPTDPDYPIDPNGGQLRGNPNNKDSYFTCNFKAGISFGRKRITRMTPQCF